MKTFILLIAVVAASLQGIECGSCKPVEGASTIATQSAKPCIITPESPERVHFKSPDFPNKYPLNKKCDLSISSSSGPSYLELIPNPYNIDSTDTVIIKNPFERHQQLTNADQNQTLYAAISNTGIVFESDGEKKGKGFSIQVTAKTSECHMVCDLSEGDTGVLETGNYTSSKFCEWWINGPDGCNIQLDFTELDVGTAGVDCSGDYVGVAKDGDRTYSTDSENFCGSTVPGPVTSSNSQLNVLFNGQEGGYQGFKATYTVVCSVTTTTSVSTTVGSTTVGSTSVASASVASTSVASTSAPSTSAASTSAASTSVASTTVASTSVASTTVASTSVGPTTVAPTPSCRRPYMYHPTLGCLHIGRLPFTWHFARLYCQLYGGDLFSPHTVDQTSTMQEVLSSIGSSENFWVGVYKKKFSRRWQWIGSERAVSPSEWNANGGCAASTNLFIKCAYFMAPEQPPLCSGYCTRFYKPICQLPN